MKSRRQNSDRISGLPQDIIDKILTLMSIRDALRTSILSKKWRYCWTTIPTLVFNDSDVSSGNRQLDKYKFINAILHVLLLHRAPILEFSLYINAYVYSELDQIILVLSKRNNIKKLVIRTLAVDSYLLPYSFYSLQGLEHLDLTSCIFNRPLTNKGFSMLKCLRFDEVDITNKMVLGILANCPLLEEFYWINEEEELQLTDCEFVELFKCLPSVQIVVMIKLNIKHSVAGGMPHKLPISLPNLRTLLLSVCFLELSNVLRVIICSPNLEKIDLEMCWDHDRKCVQHTYENLLDDEYYTGLQLDHLKELEMRSFHNYPVEMEFVKFIMAKSPVLKKTRIEFNADVSVDEEVKMLRDCCASPVVNFTIGHLNGLMSD